MRRGDHGVKVLTVIRVLWGRFPGKLTATVLLGLTTLQVMPTVFAWFDHHGGVTWQQCYWFWWVAGALVAGLGVTRVPFDGEGVAVRRAMRAVYLWLPLASLVAHLAMLHWVYRIGFDGAELAPCCSARRCWWRGHRRESNCGRYGL